MHRKYLQIIKNDSGAGTKTPLVAKEKTPLNTFIVKILIIKYDNE